jgi:hypothetical protein
MTSELLGPITIAVLLLLRLLVPVTVTLLLGTLLVRREAARTR